MGGKIMNRYSSYENYILHDLEKAQKRIDMYHDEMFAAAQRIRSLECDIANKNIVIGNLEKTINSLKERLKNHV